MKKFISKASLYHTAKTKQHIMGVGYFYVAKLKYETSYKIEMDHEMLWLEPDECIKGLFLEHQSWAVSRALSLGFR